MKKIFILSLLVITTILGFAQTPQKFSYQSVVRNTDSDLVTEQEVGLKISILQGSVNGSEVYIETHQPMTNVNGLLTIEIGSGNVQSGVFSDIDWSDDIYFIKSEIDPEGLSNYTIVGVSQLLSVPYALHAKTAENTFSGDYNDLSNTPPIPSLTSELTNDSGYITNADDNDSDASNEIQDLQLVGDELRITNNGTATTIDLSPYLDDTDTNTQLTEGEVDTYVSNNGYLTSFTEVDGDVNNEIQDLQLVGNDLTITNNGTATNIDLSPYLDNTDTQLTEAEVDAMADNNGYLTTEIDGDINNEIQDLQLVGNNLTITNNGTATTIDLSPYLDDTDTNTQLTESEVDTYVSNNGYLTSEVDGSTTNEIQDLQLVGNNLTITNNGSATTIDLSPYLDNTDTNTQLTESEVDTYVSNNGYLTSEVDGSNTNEIQDLQLVGNNLTITNNGSATTIDLSPYLDNTDTQLTEVEVDAMADNNGYLTTEIDGDINNEIQDLQLVGNNLTITNNGTATTIDLSPYLDDTDTNTQLTESEVDTYVSNNGYLTSFTEVDGSTTNEIQDLQLVGNNLTITNNGTATTIDLSPYLDDTDTNTQLTESEVDTYVSNNGYLTSFTEVDGSTTNEIQDLQLVGNNLTITNNGSATTIDLSPYLDDTDTNTQLNESEVDTYVSNNGYLTSFTEVDGSTTNEIQDLQLVGNNLTITNNGSATTIDLSPYLDDTDTNTQLTESEVDTYVSNNGYLTSEVDGSTANELQSLSISGHDITLSNGGGTVTVPDNNTTYSAGNQLTLSGTTFNVSEGAGSGLDADMLDGVHYTDIQTWVNSNDDNTTYIAGTGLNLSGTTFNANFGTSAGTISEGNHTHTNMVTGTGNINHIAYWNSATDLTFDNFDFFYVPTTSSLYMGANSGGSQLNMWGDASIQLQNSNSFTANGDRLGYLGFTDNHLNTPTAKIVAYRGNAGGSGDLPTDIAFETTADGTTTLVERMRISHNGNIGIGTPSPFYRLHIQNLDHYRSMHIAHNNSLSIDYQKGIALYMNVTSAEPAGILSEVKTTSVGGFPISNAYAFDGMGDTRGSSGAFDKAAGGYFEGWADYVAYGVLAHGRSTQSAYGVYGTAQSGTTRYGVAGYADAAIVNSYAVYAMGDFTATGTKAATVKTENGPKELYSQESPEIWFEDFGGAKVNNGIAKVDLKDDFLSTVTINNEHPIKVFITPNSNLGNWWVEKKGISFVLHAPDATDGSEFDFRVVAKRAGYEDYRMEDAPAAYADYNLYKNIDEVPEEYRSIWIQNAPDEVKERYPQYYNSKSKENLEDRK